MILLNNTFRTNKIAYIGFNDDNFSKHQYMEANKNPMSDWKYEICPTIGKYPGFTESFKCYPTIMVNRQDDLIEICVNPMASMYKMRMSINIEDAKFLRKLLDDVIDPK